MNPNPPSPQPSAVAAISEQTKALPGTESAQSAIESVAQFVHVYGQPKISTQYGHQANFCESHKTGLQISLTVHDGKPHARFCFEPREAGSDIGVYINKDANAADLFEAARAMLDAAHYLQSQAAASKVTA